MFKNTFLLKIYRTTSIRAYSSISTSYRIVRTPSTIVRPLLTFEIIFGISIAAISNQGFPGQKCQEVQEIAQNQSFFIQKK